ncbi:unnamed protein product, partial [marine sediment metagenome]
CDADHDLMTVYTVGERIPVWILGCGADVYVLIGDDATHTFTKKDIVDLADLTTYSGMGKKKDAYVAVTTDTADATGRGYTTLFWIGKALEGGVCTAASARYVPVKLSF